MSIRVPRRAALVAAAVAAIAVLAGGLIPGAAWASTTGSADPCTSNCPLIMMVMSGLTTPDNPQSLTVPWAAPASLPDPPLQMAANADIMINTELPEGGYLSLYIDGNLLGTSPDPLCDRPYEPACDGETTGDSYWLPMSTAQYEALPFGTHSFFAEFTAGSQTWYSQAVTVTFEPPPDGTIIQDASTGEMSVMAGGDRVVLAYPPAGATIISMPDSAYQSLPAAPNGTLIRDPAGDVYEIVDGVALHFASVSDLNSSGLDTADIYDVPASVPGCFLPWLPNGTLLHDNVTEADSVLAGGAQVQFLNWAEVTSAGITSQSQFIDVPPSYFAALPTWPAPNTYVRGDASSQVYKLDLGEKFPVTAPAGVTPVVVSQSWLDTVKAAG